MPNTLTVVSDQEANETADFVVCVLATEPLLYFDNRVAMCCQCFRTIQHRPHAPKFPKKICFECIKDDLERSQAAGTVDWIINPSTFKEITEYERKKRAN